MTKSRETGEPCGTPTETGAERFGAWVDKGDCPI